MGTLKKYRFRLAWQNYRVGQVIEPTGTVRDWLLAHGYIEPVAEPVPERVEPPEEPKSELPALPLQSVPTIPTFRKRQRVEP